MRGRPGTGLTGEGEEQTHRPLHSMLSCHLEILTFTFDRVFASEGHWDSGTAHEQRPCPPDTSLSCLHDTRNAVFLRIHTAGGQGAMFTQSRT